MRGLSSWRMKLPMCARRSVKDLSVWDQAKGRIAPLAYLCITRRRQREPGSRVKAAEFPTNLLSAYDSLTNYSLIVRAL